MSGGYYYLKERTDGDFDHISVDPDGVETVISVIPAADKDHPWGRPDVSEIESMNRSLRNSKLSETDWMGMSDVSMTDAQKTYRQELRDLSEHPNWPWLKPEDWPVLG